MAALMILSLALVATSRTYGSTSNTYGLMKLSVPEIEFNRGMKHIIENHLIPYVKEEYQFEEYVFKFGRTTALYINRIKIVTLDSVTTNIQLMPNNEVIIAAQLSVLAMSANFTFVTSEIDNYEDAVITLTEPSISVKLKIGTGPTGTSVDISDCSANFDHIGSSNQEVDGHLYALIEFGAKGTLKELVEHICPYLRDEASVALSNILEIEETLTITDAAKKRLNVNIRLEYSETSTDLASVFASVANIGQSIPTINRADVQFPAALARRIELCLDTPLLEILMESVVSDSVFSDSTYTILNNGAVVYQVSAKPYSVQYSLNITPDGAVFRTQNSVVLQHIGQAQNPCVVLTLVMVISAPLVVINNDRTILIAPDFERLKIAYKIANVTGKCSLPDGVDLVKEYNKHFQKVLREHYVDIEVIRTQYLGLKDLAIKHHKGAVCIGALLDLNVDVAPSAFNHTVHHRTATGKRVVVETLAGEETVIEYHHLVAPPPPDVSTAANIAIHKTLIFFIVLLLLTTYI